jgi:hypothetical protein
MWKLSLTEWNELRALNPAEKTSWSLKTSFWNKNCPINSKTVMKNVSHVRFTWKSLQFMVLGYPSKNSQNHGNLYVWKMFMTVCGWTNFLPKWFYKLQDDLSEHGIKSIPWEWTRHTLFNRFVTNQRYLKDSKNIYFDFRKKYWGLSQEPDVLRKI